MMRAWREKNKLVSQMGLQFSNVCKKKKDFSLGAQFFQYTFHGSFFQKKRNYHSWFYFVALLVISRGSFLFMAKLFHFLFLCWLVVWRRHFDQLIKLEPCCSINYNTYCLKNIQTKHRSKMFHKKKTNFTQRGGIRGNLVFENDMLKLVNITSV